MVAVLKYRFIAMFLIKVIVYSETVIFLKKNIYSYIQYNIKKKGMGK